jgi:hypothetical protein
LEKRINGLSEINELLQMTRIRERLEKHPNEREQLKKDINALHPTYFLHEEYVFYLFIVILCFRLLMLILCYFIYFIFLFICFIYFDV